MGRSLLAVLIFCLVPSAASAQRAPVWVTWHEDPANEVIVSWLSDSPDVGRVEWGVAEAGEVKYTNSAGAAPIRADDDIDAWIHHAEIAILKPNAQIRFRVASGSATSDEYWFKSAPVDATPFVLLAGGDSRSDSVARRKVNQRIRALTADTGALALAHGGDFIVDGGSWSQWRQWLQDWQETVGEDGRVLPIIPTRGNHEGDGELYNRIFGFPGDPAARGDWWVTRIGTDFALITLDSNSSQSGQQRDWLRATLKSLQDRRWLAVQYHRPAYPAVKSPGGALYHWVPIFEQYNVDMVLESDGHVLKRTVPIRDGQKSATGIVYLGEGGLGVPQRTPRTDHWYLQPPGMAMSSHHVQLLSVSPDRIEYRAVDPEGEVLDKWEFKPKRVGSRTLPNDSFVALPVGPEPPPPNPPLFYCATSRSSSDAPLWLMFVALVFASVGRRRRYLGVVLAATGLFGCGTDPCQQNVLASGVRVHAVGDSVLWWNGAFCGSIPDILGVHLGGAAVRNSAVAGAHLTTNDRPIADQSKDDDWDWVIVNGGGNDLNNCGCDEGCDAELRGLSSVDGTVGAMPRLVDGFTDDGARVIVLGYYNVGPHALYGFAGCNETFDEMDRRYEVVAAQRADVYFVDAGDVMKPDDERLYDLDFAHPSGAGSAVIAAQIAQLIETVE